MWRLRLGMRWGGRSVSATPGVLYAVEVCGFRRHGIWDTLLSPDPTARVRAVLLIPGQTDLVGEATVFAQLLLTVGREDHFMCADALRCCFGSVTGLVIRARVVRLSGRWLRNHRWFT
ncbi:hypothetical protein AQI94_31080 [Streptomyces pseudovenezuelae]|uniref:Uncharacterized protein n=1 Tax=Streptomyces pseudovenezuelae TaxID=67350 RepID=A0A117PPR9_9ACTN|nr:hypothetical protein AQI94_31080 [Streptomyces pseudovenezuelae]